MKQLILMRLDFGESILTIILIALLGELMKGYLNNYCFLKFINKRVDKFITELFMNWIR